MDAQNNIPLQSIMMYLGTQGIWADFNQIKTVVSTHIGSAISSKHFSSRGKLEGLRVDTIKEEFDHDYRYQPSAV